MIDGFMCLRRKSPVTQRTDRENRKVRQREIAAAIFFRTSFAFSRFRGFAIGASQPVRSGTATVVRSMADRCRRLHRLRRVDLFGGLP
jgi:hypothetical protein